MDTMTTNLYWARDNQSGRALKREDLKVGLLITFPSGLGGRLTYKCTSVSDERASFMSTNKEYAYGLEMLFNQPAFSLDEMELLKEALDAFNYSYGKPSPTLEQRKYVNKAYELGYANRLSHTQAQWTDYGIRQYKLLKKGYLPKAV